jgi:hypothetical protein
VVAAVYGEAGKETFLNLLQPNPWKITTLTWNGLDGENIEGGSGVSVVNDDEFYFATGGTCNNGEGLIYLQKGSKEGIQNVFNFTVSDCEFDVEDLKNKWSLQSYTFN